MGNGRSLGSSGESLLVQCQPLLSSVMPQGSSVKVRFGDSKKEIIILIVLTETISNIVFELPESSGGKTEDAASKGSGPEGSGADVEESKGEPSEARKQWKQAEGAPLVAMLQGKTLQSGTYAVGNGTTNFCGYTFFC